MTLFLSGGEAIEQYTTPTPTMMGPINIPQPDMRRAPKTLPPPLEEPGPKSGHPLTNPSKNRGTRSGEPPLQVDPHKNAEDSPHILVENSDALLPYDNVLSHPT